jgi:GxxExxY protein
MTTLLHAAISDKAWRAYYNVYNAHGHDYPEAFYEEMMRLEFIALNVPHRAQVPYEIFYKGNKVGEHVTDTELADSVVLEYKVVPALLPVHHAKLVSYLKGSGKLVGLLFNFGGPRPHGVRRVLTAIGQPNLPHGIQLTPIRTCSTQT